MPYQMFDHRRFIEFRLLGVVPGVDLPGEVNGLVPNDAWKRRTWREGWLLGDTYNFGIGQGFVLVTPIQMWNVVSAVANGGTLYQPRIVRDILDDRGNLLVPFTPRVIGHVGVDNANLEHVRLGMREAVLSGTARAANQPGLSLAAKTGTAEYGERDPTTCQYANSHAWFIGFAPAEQPRLAVAVILENGGSGGAVAAPVAGRLFAAALARGY
ncbi:MAG: hypothetical protein K6U88_06845 [Dehalococcoidia bacterium]|nr:hypothetical protein [Dehalococcoidia bacterium]